MSSQTNVLTFALFLLFSAKYSKSVNFTCPQNPIVGGTGTFPPDSAARFQFPINYHCKIQFKIQDGFVVRLTFSSKATAADSIIVSNVLGSSYAYNQGSGTFFAPATAATVSIDTSTATSEFWFSYDYQNLALFEQNPTLPTGTPLNLNLQPTQTYTLESPTNDNVVINVALVDQIGKTDIVIKLIYVYDGPNVNSRFVGNLYDYVNSPTLMKSSGNSTTLVNYYGPTSNSYALANDFKSLSSFEEYTFVAFSKNVTVPKNFKVKGIPFTSSAFTFLCTQSSMVYLTDLNFGANGHKVDVQTLTPSDNQITYLTYLATDAVQNSMPQMIPAKLFSMVTLGPELSLTLSSTADNWLTPYNGRKGSIFSSSLWTPEATSGYNHTFVSTNVMTFTFNIKKAIIHQAGEQMHVQVGLPGFKPSSLTFTNSVSDQSRLANGTYLMIEYIGDSTSSSSIVTFEMANANGEQGTSYLPSKSTSSSIQSTTKSGLKNTFGIASGISLLIALFLNC
ncbi:CUB-like domain-containing protein [Caenorhabditis elegans]|uniref:CUB-like domain-containing protein n=2 Tax=Caenorhabditis elegans TaxID=6239 RepID=G5EFQ6_CAEEL|nr:CUB-like domain-containing protein [Caenorhabditis elegans]CAB04278.2 CUB-like domain-containing protein [Caenorhabditis elegans]|eukprot:NP_001256543.1 Cub (CUB) Like Domain containing protein [Caenorhabditis elegans]